MIITDNFVFIHFPKTGGTFVTKVMRKIHNRKDPDWWVNRLYNKWLGGGHKVNYKEVNKHGSCREIPNSHESKLIFSAIRDPFEWYVSEYFFGWWKRYPEQYGVNESYMTEKYPSFPNLSFPQYVKACCEDFSTRFDVNTNFYKENGWYSRRIIDFYFREPNTIEYQCSESDIGDIEFDKYMFDVKFLNTESINDDLFNVLKGLGYENIDFIRGLGRVRPDDQYESRKKSAEELFTSELTEYVLDKEELFFNIFKEYKKSNTLNVYVEDE